MKKAFARLRDTFIAGLIFILPLLVLLVLISKIFQFFKGFTSKVAAAFGMKDFLGLPAATMAGGISFILLCLLFGIIVRISFFKHISTWVDAKLKQTVPGYAVYHEMAMSKLEKKQEVLPYQSAALFEEDGIEKVVFVMETLHDGRQVVLLPSAGNTSEGEVFICAASRLKPIGDQKNLKAVKLTMDNLGLGLRDIIEPVPRQQTAGTA